MEGTAESESLLLPQLTSVLEEDCAVAFTWRLQPLGRSSKERGITGFVRESRVDKGSEHQREGGGFKVDCIIVKGRWLQPL